MSELLQPLIQITAAAPHELREALRLMFQQLPDDDRHRSTARALQLIDKGELANDGIFVARDDKGVCGMVAVQANAGAAGQIWPPQTTERCPRGIVEDALIQHAIDKLHQRGARYVQALLAPDEIPHGESLPRNGFTYLTELHSLCHHLENISIPMPNRLVEFSNYDRVDAALFAQTMLRTYDDAHDFPELNGLRTKEQIIAGHMACGNFDPARWLLLLHGQRPAGVLLLTAVPEWNEWELSYLGVTPGERGQGLGRVLVERALIEARTGGADRLIVSVDQRNVAARALYQRCGFEPLEERQAWLRVL